MLISVLTFVIGLIGACLVSFGAWLYSPAAGFITGGVVCLFWSFIAAQAAPQSVPQTGGE